MSSFQYQEGEWVLFQQRGQFGNPEDYFARDMTEYIVGFGDPSKEFWLGLDKLGSLTKNGAELFVELETFEVMFLKIIMIILRLPFFRVKKSMPSIPVSKLKVLSTESMCLDILEMQEIQ